MTQNDLAQRVNSQTSASTDSGHSQLTITPSNVPRRPPIEPNETTWKHRKESRSSDSDNRVSPTRTIERHRLGGMSEERVRKQRHRMSTLDNHRRDLAALDMSSGPRVPQIQQVPPTAGASPQVAPWMTQDDRSATSPTGQTSFYYNDSNESLPLSHQGQSQQSPNHLRTGSRSAFVLADRDPAGAPSSSYNDERRPSVASIATTVSSTGSKQSGQRGGFRKLQGFFGEEFPGRDGSDASLPASLHKDNRSRSYSHSRSIRGRQYSNATDREPSPTPSRPRTPAPEVVPFLYQDNSDIARYGEAPVRETLTGPDRERYVAERENYAAAHPPKTSSSSRSGQSGPYYAQGFQHRHNKSNDDSQSLRQTNSREEAALAGAWSRSGAGTGASNATMYNNNHNSNRSRGQSPTPSTSSHAPSHHSKHDAHKHGQTDGTASPAHGGKRGILGRLRRHHHHKDKDKDSAGDSSKLRDLPPSTRSLQTKTSRSDFHKADTTPSTFPSHAFDSGDTAAHDPRPVPQQRNATFNNKFPFAKKGRGARAHDYGDDIGPTDKRDGAGNMYHLDTNLNDMEGILTKPPPLTPMDTSFVNAMDQEPAESAAMPAAATAPKSRWDAPDSWAVRRNTEDTSQNTAPDMDDIGSPPRPEEKRQPYCIRIFKSNGGYVTHSMPLDSTVTDVISQVIKKTYMVDSLEDYHIILQKHDLMRVLNAQERPLLLQKRLLQQVGYEENDRIEDLGREDIGYLCRFMFLSARESDFHTRTADLGIKPGQKLNHVDLSGRNLITIPISLYKPAAGIISLNLSRNLSLDIPKDFVQSCTHLRDVKFTNNEARKLPPLQLATKLSYLDVSNNRLEQLENAELHTLTSLVKLNLANNRLSSLPTYFSSYCALRTLTLSSNFLESFPGFMCDLASLVDLDLSFNSISALPDNIGNLTNLERLLVTNNRISTPLPGSFEKLSSLRELDIKFNNIREIDTISKLPKLEVLYAEHNGVSVFVGKFQSLRHLKLNSNPLNKFEITEPIPTLKVLNLSTAQLASIDSAFAMITNLEHLNLNHNYFVSLPQQIGALTQLEYLSIAHNSVGELPPQIGCLAELRFLDIRGNNMSKLPMELWWANRLETLNASSNCIESFPKPASKAPRVLGEDQPGPPPAQTGRSLTLGTLSTSASTENLDEERRPSQASSTLLSVGPSPLSEADRKGSVVSVYGKGGRKTSVVSRTTTSNSNTSGKAMPPPTVRKDSNLTSRMTNTFAGTLRHLYLADNRLDDEVFDQIALCSELRVLNISYNEEIGDVPQRCITSWPQLVELYLSGNSLTNLPADDLDESSLLQTLYINGNKFTNLPADISRARKLAVLDCGSNHLKYNISNVPYDWNWNLNPNLRYLNLSGNKRLEIKQTGWPGATGAGAQNREQYADFSRLLNLRVLGLMDVTLTQPSIPDQSEDRRVRTSGSLAGHLPYGMADTLGKNEHLSTVDLVVPRFNSSETEMLLGLFDGQALSSGGSKIAKYLHENFGATFAAELKSMKIRQDGTPVDALRRAFLSLNRDLVTIQERPKPGPKGTTQSVILTKEDLNSGGVATVVYLQGTELFVANVGDAQAMIIQNDGGHKFLTRKHDPAEPTERSRIRDAGGWVSRNGKLNDLLDVSRAFGYADLMPVVQAAPHISHMAIRESDEFILMATKELWEYLSPGLVTDIARAERQDLMKAAQKLRDYAMAYGATNKIMVMMISVADLKRRVERSRLHRGTSMSLYPSGVPDEVQTLATRKRGKARADILDSSLNRLDAEIPAPTGNVSIAFTDIKNSTTLWELHPNAMRSAIKLHNEVMRRQLRQVGGYEVKTEGDAFMVSFPTATSALLWCFAVQTSLLNVNWPSEIMGSMTCQQLYDKDDNCIFRGLSVRMGIHYGQAVSETDPVTRRMDYFGPMVNKASRISAIADGGQIAVSSDFISEIQRCLESYQDIDRSGSQTSEDTYEDESFAASIRKDLRSLTSQGFEVKEMGERKLKGLENPEIVYSLYPHQLASRIEYHTQREVRDEGAETKPTVAPGDHPLSFDPNLIFQLWKVSLRLEMLCSTLEEVRSGLQPPETELMEKMRMRAGEVTENFLFSFMEHQVSRVETAISTLAMRHLAIDKQTLHELNDLRAPMQHVLDKFVKDQKKLAKYKAKYGDISSSEDEDDEDGVEEQNDDDDDDSNDDRVQELDSSEDDDD